MYSTCLFCNTSLGTNDAIEHFAVGRRLAYDAATGRLWVVCRQCERWNLSPLESRWEAIEEAERLFRATKLRVSTDNIGLAQLKDGTELVRIGAPPKLEFAAWRYGDQFGRRWRRYAVGTAAVAAEPMGQLTWQGLNIAGGVFHVMNGPTAIAAMMAGMGVCGVGVGFKLVRHYRERLPSIVVRDEQGGVVRTNLAAVDQSGVIAPNNGRGWEFVFPRIETRTSGPIRMALGQPLRVVGHPKQFVHLHGETALRALAVVLPHVNRGGGRRAQINDAVNAVNNAKSVANILLDAPLDTRRRSIFERRDRSSLSMMPAPIRLALEMSLHADDERRAMEGELHVLEQRWRDADAIAKISDTMFLPDALNGRIVELRKDDDDDTGNRAPSTRA